MGRLTETSNICIASHLASTMGPGRTQRLSTKLGWPADYTGQELYMALYALGLGDATDDVIVNEFRKYKSAVIFAIQSYKLSERKGIDKLVWRIQRLKGISEKTQGM